MRGYLFYICAAVNLELQVSWGMFCSPPLTADTPVLVSRKLGDESGGQEMDGVCLCPHIHWAPGPDSPKAQEVPQPMGKHCHPPHCRPSIPGRSGILGSMSIHGKHLVGPQTRLQGTTFTQSSSGCPRAKEDYRGTFLSGPLCHQSQLPFVLLSGYSPWGAFWLIMITRFS